MRVYWTDGMSIYCKTRLPNGSRYIDGRKRYWVESLWQPGEGFRDFKKAANDAECWWNKRPKKRLRLRKRRVMIIM